MEHFGATYNKLKNFETLFKGSIQIFRWQPCSAASLHTAPGRSGSGRPPWAWSCWSRWGGWWSQRGGWRGPSTPTRTPRYLPPKVPWPSISPGSPRALLQDPATEPPPTGNPPSEKNSKQSLWNFFFYLVQTCFKQFSFCNFFVF